MSDYVYRFDWALYACDDDPEFNDTDEFRDDPNYVPDEWLL